MRDLNFLNSHIDARTSFVSKYRNIILITCSFVVLLAGVYLFNVYRISGYKAEITAAQAFLNSSDNLQKLKVYRDTVSKNEELNKYYKKIQEINSSLDAVDRINSKLIEKIASLMPVNTFIQSLSIGTGTIDIKGVAETRVAIAELQYNLKQEAGFSDIFIDSITRDASTKESYSFTLKCGLKGVN